jgi:hypothetical protein
MERIEGSTDPARAETLPTELVIRCSCGCPAETSTAETSTAETSPAGTTEAKE